MLNIFTFICTCYLGSLLSQKKMIKSWMKLTQWDFYLCIDTGSKTASFLLMLNWSEDYTTIDCVKLTHKFYLNDIGFCVKTLLRSRQTILPSEAYADFPFTAYSLPCSKLFLNKCWTLLVQHKLYIFQNSSIS